MRRVGTLFGRAIHGLLLSAAVTFLLAPTIVIATTSFSNDAFIDFPPHRWGVSAYRAFFSSGSTWFQPLERSLILATTVALCQQALEYSRRLAYIERPYRAVTPYSS